MNVHNVSVKLQLEEVFIGHVTCSGTHIGGLVSQKLKDFTPQHGVSRSQKAMVGGDGRTRWSAGEGGWMARLEAKLGQPRTRIMCLCLQVKVHYRALFLRQDGET